LGLKSLESRKKFDIEEKALVLGTELYYRVAIAYLKEAVS